MNPHANTDTIAGPSFYLVVTGAGSWGGGNPFRSYKAGVHEISAGAAEAVLAFKETHPNTPWVILSDVRPEIENGSLIGPLLPEDLKPGARSCAVSRCPRASSRE